MILNNNGLAHVTNMIVDGVEMEAKSYYQFDTVGNHVVEFVLYDPTNIGNAFSYCTGLTSIVIPDSVTTIGDSAFYKCSELTEITSHAIIAPTIKSNTFRDVQSGGTLYVPSGSTDSYSTWMSTSSYYLGKYNWTIQYI